MYVLKKFSAKQDPIYAYNSPYKKLDSAFLYKNEAYHPRINNIIGPRINPQFSNISPTKVATLELCCRSALGAVTLTHSVALDKSNSPEPKKLLKKFTKVLPIHSGYSPKIKYLLFNIPVRPVRPENK